MRCRSRHRANRRSARRSSAGHGLAAELGAQAEATFASEDHATVHTRSRYDGGRESVSFFTSPRPVAANSATAVVSRSATSGESFRSARRVAGSHSTRLLMREHSWMH